MHKKIENIKNQAKKEIEQCLDLKSLENLKIKYLGRKGEVSSILRSLTSLSVEDKRTIGPKAQSLKNEIDIFIKTKIRNLLDKKRTPIIDITTPGKKIKTGHLHPLTIIGKEIIEIFKNMGFSVCDGGPEIENEYYNFDALNIPKNHPAREMHDTFWVKKSSNPSKGINDNLLLRTHTSPMQIRYMEKHNPPFRIIVPGRVFRYEATDASHEINFNHIECLMVGEDVNFSNFKYIVQEFFNKLFSIRKRSSSKNKKINIRYRPSYFPFVEPGLEIDIQCVKCGGKGCNICAGSGWLEVMGAGMVHPNVLKAVGYNPKKYQGFAFGVGTERIAMLKYNIPDIRMFYDGDLRFINQF
ncbi:phenylalanine--tRNA ligase subunit alpha [Patescibacteria group bacterium]|nr:phenylalanine--tRNA ligase subunit alpha [Patescibacteria group bacterium]